MRKPILFVTGTDTGVGKTVLTVLLARHFCQQGKRVAALKPICSGDRKDARALHIATKRTLPLNDVNPWHFTRAIAPVLAARREKKCVRLAQVKQHVQKISRIFEPVIVEGAGGLLSPLGEHFDSRDLIVTLRASPVVVVPNRLGAINQVRLVLDALPKRARVDAQVVLMTQKKADASSKDNQKLLGEYFPSSKIHVIPWLTARKIFSEKLDASLARTLDQIASVPKN